MRKFPNGSIPCPYPIQKLAKAHYVLMNIECSQETLDEIENEYRHEFMQLGGEQFSYIPALNDRKAHIEMMRQLVQPYLD